MSTQDIRKAMAAGAAEVELRAGPVSFELVWIPPGEFMIGSHPEEQGHRPNESPRRRVRLTKGFYLARFEVTQHQYKSLMGRSPSSFRGDALAQDQITHPRAIEFCEEVSRLTGLNVVLPTEAQWEYACRAGTTTRFYTGDTLADLERAGWVSENAGDTVHPVGLKAPNAFGLYDMHGNVWELCADFLGDYATISTEDPVGPPGQRGGAMRGGGYTHDADDARSASRLKSDAMFGGAGIRIAVQP